MPLQDRCLYDDKLTNDGDGSERSKGKQIIYSFRVYRVRVSDDITGALRASFEEAQATVAKVTMAGSWYFVSDRLHVSAKLAENACWKLRPLCFPSFYWSLDCSHQG